MPSLLEMALAASIDGVLAFDLDCRYTLWNPAMERISGVPASQVLGRLATEVFPFLESSGEIAVFRRALAGESVITRSARYDVPETRRHGFFDGHYQPVLDDAGAIIGGIGIIREVTARAELEQINRWFPNDPAEAAQRLTFALRAAELGTFDWDATTDEIVLGERAAQIYGVAPDRSHRRSELRALLLPEEQQASHDRLRESLAAHEPYHVEYRLRQPGGALVWIAATGQTIYDADGTPRRQIGVVQDITARKEAEQVLLDQGRVVDTVQRIGSLLLGELDLERLLQAITDAATEITNAQFGSFFYNVVDQRGERYTLYTLSGVPRSAFESFPMPRNTAVFAPTFSGAGTVRSDDITRDPRYGHTDPYRGMPKGHLPVRSYLAVSVVSRTGEVIGGLFFGHAQPGVFTARHERIVEGIAPYAALAIENARIYQAARDRADALAEAARLKDEFLAMLAHELRNPLGAVFNAVQVLSQAERSDSRFSRAIDVATRQIEHQKKLVDDLLDVSRVSRGKIELDLETVDLAALVRDAVEDHRPMIHAAGIELVTEVPEVPAPVVGDAVRLAQAFGNLLDNARKFTPRGGRVTVRVTTGETTTVVVEDTGIGIEAEMLPRLFEAFVQAGRAIDRSLGGLGLGLALVKGLVEQHAGGRVEAHSAGPGRGARFQFTLPTATGVAAAQAPVRRTLSRRRRVLLVEDQIDAAETLRDLLELMGCVADVAHDVPSALALLDEHELVLCDVGLPGAMNGLDLARTVRGRGGRQPVLVALTGYGAAEDQRATRDAGFDVHLTKPLQLERIVEILEKLS